MNVIVSKLGMCGLFVILTVVSGIVLSNSGKPHNSLIFTIHKLVAIGTVIVMGVNIYHLNQAGGVHILHVVSFGATGLFFLALIVSGSVLSLVTAALLELDDTALRAVLTVHQIVPLLALVASGVSIYLLVGSEA